MVEKPVVPEREEFLLPETVDVAEPEPLSQRYPELAAEPIDKRPLIYGTIFAVVFVLIFLAIGVWLFLNPAATAILRDIFIIYLGLGAFVIILLLVALVVITTYLVIKINDLVQLLDREIKPILLNLQGTVATVQGTTTFISDHAVQPIIATVSAYAATRAVFRTLFRRK